MPENRKPKAHSFTSTPGTSFLGPRKLVPGVDVKLTTSAADSLEESTIKDMGTLKGFLYELSDKGFRGDHPMFGDTKAAFVALYGQGMNMTQGAGDSEHPFACSPEAMGKTLTIARDALARARDGDSTDEEEPERMVPVSEKEKFKKDFNNFLDTTAPWVDLSNIMQKDRPARALNPTNLPRKKARELLVWCIKLTQKVPASSTSFEAVVLRHNIFKLYRSCCKLSDVKDKCWEQADNAGLRMVELGAKREGHLEHPMVNNLCREYGSFLDTRAKAGTLSESQMGRNDPSTEIRLASTEELNLMKGGLDKDTPGRLGGMFTQENPDGTKSFLETRIFAEGEVPADVKKQMDEMERDAAEAEGKRREKGKAVVAEVERKALEVREKVMRGEDGLDS